MEIKKIATCGTTESGDIKVTVSPSNENQINVELSSVVMEQFGDHIEELIIKTAQDMGLKGGLITANDRGALDCTIKARVEIALSRSLNDDSNLEWR